MVEGDALRDSPGSVLLPQAQVSEQSFSCLRMASAVRPREANERKGRATLTMLFGTGSRKLILHAATAPHEHFRAGDFFA
jgi:hypothetical protein